MKLPEVSSEGARAARVLDLLQIERRGRKELVTGEGEAEMIGISKQSTNAIISKMSLEFHARILLRASERKLATAGATACCSTYERDTRAAVNVDKLRPE